MTKRVIVSLLLAVMACGGDSEDAEEPMQEMDMLEGDGERMGPVGCYIAAQMMCDCALTEAMCSEAAGMFWVPGCMSCGK